jgi:hypothetical protein
LKRPRGDRWIAGASLVLLTLLSWLSLAVAADAMQAMTGEGGSATYLWLMPMGRWGATEFVLGLAMWAIMMIGRWYRAPLFWPYGLQVGLQPAHGDWHRTSKMDI